MKIKLLLLITSYLIFSVSLFAHCPNKKIKSQFISYDVDSNEIKVIQKKRTKSIKISEKTKYHGIKNVHDIKKGDIILIDGCNCKSRIATKIYLANK